MQLWGAKYKLDIHYIRRAAVDVVGAADKLITLLTRKGFCGAKLLQLSHAKPQAKHGKWGVGSDWITEVGKQWKIMSVYWWVIYSRRAKIIEAASHLNRQIVCRRFVWSYVCINTRGCNRHMSKCVLDEIKRRASLNRMTCVTMP